MHIVSSYLWWSSPLVAAAMDARSCESTANCTKSSSGPASTTHSMVSGHGVRTGFNVNSYYSQRSPVERTGREDDAASSGCWLIVGMPAPPPIAHQCTPAGAVTSRCCTTVWNVRRRRISAADKPALQNV